jgi:hypothetical protein
MRDLILESEGDGRRIVFAFRELAEFGISGRWRGIRKAHFALRVVRKRDGGCGSVEKGYLGYQTTCVRLPEAISSSLARRIISQDEMHLRNCSSA